jgi:hypothetical protein
MRRHSPNVPISFFPLVLLGIVTLAGCAGSAGLYSTDGPELLRSNYAAVGAREVLEDPSLFKSDMEVLSDSAIRRILEYRLSLPDSSRLAILELAARSVQDWRWTAESRTPAEVLTELVATLEASRRVRSASVLPSLLVPRERAVGFLREAAARYQADLLLVFRTDCRSYQRERFLSATTVKANCTVESVLIDTRSGIVPFTGTVSRSYEARRTREDASFTETVRRTELETIQGGLAELGAKVAAFLEGR